MLVEADESGSSMAPRFTMHPRQGIASLYRHPFQPDALDKAVQLSPFEGRARDFQVLVGMESAGRRDRSAVFWKSFASQLEVLDTDVVIDAGRLLDASPLIDVLAASQLVIAVARPNVEQVFHTQQLVHRLQSLGKGVLTAVALVDEGPYGADDLSEAIDSPVLGDLPMDHRSAAILSGASSSRSLPPKGSLMPAAHALVRRAMSLRPIPDMPPASPMFVRT